MSKVALQFRIDEETYEKVRTIAEKEIRSINAQLEYFVLKGVQQYEESNGDVTQSE